VIGCECRGPRPAQRSALQKFKIRGHRHAARLTHRSRSPALPPRVLEASVHLSVSLLRRTRRSNRAALPHRPPSTPRALNVEMARSLLTLAALAAAALAPSARAA
jgi:hypothetical protein